MELVALNRYTDNRGTAIPMYCPKCSAENPHQAHSCLSCGAALPAGGFGDGGYAAAATHAVPPPTSLAYRHAAPNTLYHTSLPAKDNTSGHGDVAAAPAGVGGWSFAAAVPFGLFALYNGMQVWGIIGILLTVFGLWLGPLALPFCIGYIVYLGIKGRELAWHWRRFADRTQFEATMRVWNIAGVFSLIIGPLIWLVWTVLLLSNMFNSPGFVADTCDPGGYTGG